MAVTCLILDSARSAAGMHFHCTSWSSLTALSCHIWASSFERLACRQEVLLPFAAGLLSVVHQLLAAGQTVTQPTLQQQDRPLDQYSATVQAQCCANRCICES